MAKPNSMSGVTKDLMAMQDAGMEAILTLVTGGSKVQAAFAGIKTAILTKAIGPLAQIVGITTGVVGAIKKLSSEFGTMGAQAAASIEMLEQQFRPLLKSIEAAKNRMAELKKFSTETPFGMKEVAAANKILENFSKGALSTKQGMVLVGDAAAVAGQSLEGVAMWVGRLYDSLQSGRPIGEAAARLQEMGVMSGSARNAIEEMSVSGATFAQTWKIVEVELGRSRGGMEYTSKTLQSLQQQLEDVKESMSADFGQGFLKGEKLGVEAQIKAMELMKPAIAEWGEALGSGREMVNSFKASLVNTAGKIPGVAGAITVAGSAFSVFNALLSAVSVGGIAKFVAGAVGLTGTIGDNVSATNGAKGAMGSFGTALEKLKMGYIQDAAAATKSGFAQAFATVKANGLKGALIVLAAAFRTVAAAMWASARALLVNPWIMAAAAISTLIAIMYHFNQEAKKSAAATAAYRVETDGLAQSLRDATDAIATASDLMGQYGVVTRKTADAYRDLADAQSENDSSKEATARERIAALMAERKAIDDKASVTPLRRNEAVVDYEIQNRIQGKQLAEQDELKRIDLLPGDQRETARKVFYEKQLKDQQEAMAEYQKSLASLDLNQVSTAKKDADRGIKRAEIEGQIKVRENAMAKAEEEHKVQRYQVAEALDPALTQNFDEEFAKKTQEAKAAIDGLRKKIADLGTAEEDAMSIADQSGSRLAVLKSMTALYQSYQAAVKSATSAQHAFDEANRVTGEDRNEQEISQKRNVMRDSVQRRDALASSVERRFGTANPGVASQNAEVEAKVIEADLQRRSDPNRASEARAALQSISTSEAANIANEQVTAAERVAQLQDDQVKAQMQALDLARTRIALEIQFNGLSSQAAEARLAALAAEEESIREIASRRKQAAEVEAETGTMDAEAGRLRSEGDTGSARVIEKGAQRKRSAQQAEETYRRVLGETGNDATAQKVSKSEEQAANKKFDTAQADEARNQKFSKAQQGAGQKANDMDNKAQEAQYAGMADYAAALREAAARLREEAGKEQAVLEAQAKYGVSKIEATKMVEKEIESARKSRAIEEKRRQLEQKLMKEREKSEAKADRKESRGDKNGAERDREKQRKKDREQDLIDKGFDRKEAAKQASGEEKTARQARNSANYRAAEQAWLEFMEQIRALIKRRKEYMDDLETLKQRARGDDAGADAKEEQKDFDRAVKKLMEDLKVSQAEAERLENERRRALFEIDKQIDKRKRLEDLNKQLEGKKKEKGEAVRAASKKGEAVRAASKKGEAVRAASMSGEVKGQGVTSSLGRIGGASAQSASYYSLVFDVSEVRRNTQEMRELLKLIAQVSNETYYIHRMSPQDSGGKRAGGK